MTDRRSAEGADNGAENFDRCLEASHPVTLAVALVALSAGPALADSAESGRRSLVGAWSVQVTLRNCATGAPSGPPFNSLVTFHHGGTVSEAAGSPAFAPGQRGRRAWRVDAQARPHLRAVHGCACPLRYAAEPALYTRVRP